MSTTTTIPNQNWVGGAQITQRYVCTHIREAEYERFQRYIEQGVDVSDGKSVPEHLRSDHVACACATCIENCVEIMRARLVKSVGVRLTTRLLLSGQLALCCRSIFVHAQSTTAWKAYANDACVFFEIAAELMQSTTHVSIGRVNVYFSGAAKVVVSLGHFTRYNGVSDVGEQPESDSKEIDVYDIWAQTHVIGDVAIVNLFSYMLSARRIEFGLDSLRISISVSRHEYDSGAEATTSTIDGRLSCDMKVISRRGPSATTYSVVNDVPRAFACDCDESSVLTANAMKTMTVDVSHYGAVASAVIKLCCGAFIVNCSTRKDDEDEERVFYRAYDFLLETYANELLFPGALEGVVIKRAHAWDSEEKRTNSPVHAFFADDEMLRVFRLTEHTMYAFLHPLLYDVCFRLTDDFVLEWTEIDYDRVPSAYNHGAHIRCAASAYGSQFDDSNGDVGAVCIEHVPNNTLVIRDAFGVTNNSSSELFSCLYFGVLSIRNLRPRILDDVWQYKHACLWREECQRESFCQCPPQRLRDMTAKFNFAQQHQHQRHSRGKMASFAQVHPVACASGCDPRVASFFDPDRREQHRNRLQAYVDNRSGASERSWRLYASRVSADAEVRIDRLTPHAMQFKNHYCVFVKGVEFAHLRIQVGITCSLHCDDDRWVRQFAFCTGVRDVASGCVEPKCTSSNISQDATSAAQYGVEEFRKSVPAERIRKSSVQFTLTDAFVRWCAEDLKRVLCFGYVHNGSFIAHGTLEHADDSCATHFEALPSKLDVRSRLQPLDVDTTPPSPPARDLPLEKSNRERGGRSANSVPSSSTCNKDSPLKSSASADDDASLLEGDIFAKEIKPVLKTYGLVFLLTTLARCRTPQTNNNNANMYRLSTPLMPVDAPRSWTVAFVNVGTDVCKRGLRDVKTLHKISTKRVAGTKLMMRGNVFWRFAFVMDKDVGADVDDCDNWPQLKLGCSVERSGSGGGGGSAGSGEVFVPSLTNFGDRIRWSDVVFIPRNGESKPSEVLTSDVMRCPIYVRDTDDRMVCHMHQRKTSKS